MSDTIKTLTKDEIESGIRNGIRPAMGDTQTIMSVIGNHLPGQWSWVKENGVLKAGHERCDIVINGLNVTFNWKG